MNQIDRPWEAWDKEWNMNEERRLDHKVLFPVQFLMLLVVPLNRLWLSTLKTIWTIPRFNSWQIYCSTHPQTGCDLILEVHNQMFQWRWLRDDYLIFSVSSLRVRWDCISAGRISNMYFLPAKEPWSATWPRAINHNSHCHFQIRKPKTLVGLL